MSRIPRKNNETSIFHIITQGINKIYIFDKTEDINYYIKLIKRIEKEQDIEIIAYCIMNNHAHMLIKTKNVSEMSKYMQRVNTSYGKYYNNKYDRVGYVFRDRYKAEGIYTEKHLYNCISYIYNNPVKAGICNKPEQYTYSNYKKTNIKMDEDEIFMDIEEDKEVLCKKVIGRFLSENKKEMEDIKKDKVKLKEIIVILKDKYHISLRTIAEEIEVNRESVRKIYSQK